MVDRRRDELRRDARRDLPPDPRWRRRRRNARWADRAPLVTGATGGDIGAHHAWSIDGYTYETVARLRVRTATGIVFVYPHRYPARAVRRWPAIARTRYFVHFFAAKSKPRVITALNARGRTLASQSVSASRPSRAQRQAERIVTSAGK
jgi:hypothetical protein